MKVFSAIAFGILLWSTCRAQPAKSVWTDLREGDGSVQSLAAGTTPDGIEVVLAGGYCRTDDTGHDLRVVCLNAADGRSLWESRENRSLPNMLKDPLIVIDKAGDVLVGWHDFAGTSGTQPAICKLSGRDGKKLWEWKAKCDHDGAGLLGIPTPDQNGKIWVSGITSIGKFAYQRFLALLDGKDGTALWMKAVNEARDVSDRPAVIHPLKNGDAMVVTPPPNSETKLPWLIQRISAKDGSSFWHHEILRENDRNLQSICWSVDEAHAQIIAVWNGEASGNLQLHIASYDLNTGMERWHSSDNLPAPFPGWIQLAALGPQDSIVLWGRHIERHSHLNILQWHNEDGFWHPETWQHEYEQPMWVKLSVLDGSVKEHGLLGKPDERINAALHRPHAAGFDLLFFRETQKREQIEPWSAAWLDTSKNIPTLDESKLAPSGPAATLDFPRHAILTPSGHIVIAGNPAKDNRVWQITLW